MYSLNCDYFVQTFDDLNDLIDYVMSSGMDPNYEITRNGKPTGELAIELIGF